MKNKMKTIKKGFTLVELMIVIAIVALLSSITLVALGASREKANVAKFQQQLHSVVIALDLYKQASGSYPDQTAVTLNSLMDGSSSPLNPYLKDVIHTPLSLSSYDPDNELLYSVNPSGSDVFSCGDANASEQYVIYFATSDTGLSETSYPVLYENGTPSGTLRCAFRPNK